MNNVVNNINTASHQKELTNRCDRQLLIKREVVQNEGVKI